MNKWRGNLKSEAFIRDMVCCRHLIDSINKVNYPAGDVCCWCFTAWEFFRHFLLFLFHSRYSSMKIEKSDFFFFICTLSYFVQGACVRHKMFAVKWFQIKNEIIWNHWSQNLVRNFCSQEFVVKYWFRCENVVWWFCCQKLLSSIFNDGMRCVVSKPKIVQVRVCVCIFFFVYWSP